MRKREESANNYEEEWIVRATDNLRLLLIKNGLTEDLADAFLSRWKVEIARGMQQNDPRLAERCEIIVRELVTQQAALSRNENEQKATNIKDIIQAVVLGAAGSALWDAFKSLYEIGVRTKDGATQSISSPFLEKILIACREDNRVCWQFLLDYSLKVPVPLFEFTSGMSGSPAVRVKHLDYLRGLLSVTVENLSALSGLPLNTIKRMEDGDPVELRDAVKLVFAIETRMGPRL
jgi:hypothetical protein